MNTKTTPQPAPLDDAADDWGKPPGKPEDIRDAGILDSLGDAVSEAVKGSVPPDAAAEELIRRRRSTGA